MRVGRTFSRHRFSIRHPAPKRLSRGKASPGGASNGLDGIHPDVRARTRRHARARPHQTRSSGKIMSSPAAPPLKPIRPRDHGQFHRLLPPRRFTPFGSGCADPVLHVGRTDGTRSHGCRPCSPSLWERHCLREKTASFKTKQEAPGRRRGRSRARGNQAISAGQSRDTSIHRSIWSSSTLAASADRHEERPAPESLASQIQTKRG